MSDRTELAEHITGLSVVGLASMGVDAPALTPAAVLVAWGIERYHACSKRRQRGIVDRIVKQIEKSDPDHRATGPALALLKEHRHKIAVPPGVLAQADKRGDFPDTLYDIVFAGAGVPPDDGVEVLLRRVIDAAWQGIRLQDDFHKVFVQEAATALERDVADGFARFERQLSGIAETTDRTQAMVQTLLAREGDTARQLGIREAQLIALAQRIAESVDDADAAPRELTVAVEEAASLRAQGATPSNLGSFVDAVMARVLARSAEGDLTRAAAEAAAGLADWEAR